MLGPAFDHLLATIRFLAGLLGLETGACLLVVMSPLLAGLAVTLLVLRHQRVRSSPRG